MRTLILVLAFVSWFPACGPATAHDAGPTGGGAVGSSGGGLGTFGGGASIAGGGSTGGGDSPVASLSPLGECVGVASSDVGTRCAAGSNLALCVMQDKSTCSSVCLWDDNAPSMPRAYCSIPCTEGGGECPSGYECARQNCSVGPSHVCVRRVSGGCVPVPVFGTTARVLMSTGLRSAGAYVVGAVDANVVTVRLMEGATVVRELGTFPFGGSSGQLLSVSDTRVWWLVPPLIVRIDATAIETFPLSPNLNVLPLVSSDGEALGATRRNRFATVVLRPDAGALIEEEARLVVLHHAQRLGDGTVVGQCSDGGLQAACATRDLVTGQQLAYPPDASFLTSNVGFAGASIDDFTMVSRSGDVFRRVGEQWVADVFSREATNGSATAVGDDVYVSRQEDGGFARYLKTPTCWKPVNAPNGVFGRALPGRLYGYYSQSRWCSAVQPR